MQTQGVQTQAPVAQVPGAPVAQVPGPQGVQVQAAREAWEQVQAASEKTGTGHAGIEIGAVFIAISIVFIFVAIFLITQKAKHLKELGYMAAVAAFFFMGGGGVMVWHHYNRKHG